MNGDYWFFLGAFAAVAPSGTMTVEMSRPLGVDKSIRPQFTECLREYIAVVKKGSQESDIKDLIFRMLLSKPVFFESDAAITAGNISHWNQDELTRLGEIVEDKKSSLTEESRDNLSAIVAKFAELGLLGTFAAAEFAAGHPDPIYYGLTNRPEQLQSQVLRLLLRRKEVPVKTGALRVAGLLRLRRIIDDFDELLWRAPHARLSRKAYVERVGTYQQYESADQPV